MNNFVTLLITFIIILLVYVSLGINKLLGVLVLVLILAFLLFLKRSLLYIIKGNKAYTTGNMEEALKNYKKAAAMKNALPDTKRVYAYMLLKEKKVAEAETEIKDLLDKIKDQKSINLAKMTYSLIKWKQDKLDEAIDMLYEVYDEFKAGTIYENLGYLLILRGDYEEALKINEEGYEYDSSNNIIVDNLGETYYHLKDYDKSYELYKELIDRNPNFPEPYYHYALVLKERTEYEESITMLEKALTYKESFLSEVSHEKINKAIEEVKQLQ